MTDRDTSGIARRAPEDDMPEDKLPTEGNLAPLHTPPDFDAPAFPDLKDDSPIYRDPERGQHLIWVALALVIVLVAWWGL